MNYNVGSYYRDVYLVPSSPKQILGIAANKHDPSQIYASAPDQKASNQVAVGGGGDMG
jgi:hypothetical protein